MTHPPAAPAPEPVAPTPWKLVILLGSLTAFGTMSIDLYLPALPEIARALHSRPGQVESTVAVFVAGMAIGQMIYGPASDRFGRRVPILAGIAIYTLASVVCALAPTIEALMAARFIQALGGCAGMVIARAAVRDHFNHTETARMLSLMQLISGMGPIVAPVLGGLIATWLGWRATFWTLLIFGLGTWLAAFFWLSESRSAETLAQARREGPFRAFAALLRQRRVVGYCLAGALNGACIFSYVAAAPLVIIDVYGMSPAMFGWMFGLNGVGLLLGGQVNRYLLRRWTPDFLLARLGLVSLAFGVLLTLATFTGIGGRGGVFALLFCTITSYGLMQGNTTAGALSVDSVRSGSTSALLGAFSFGAGAAAGTLTGMLYDGSAKPMALVMTLSLAGSIAALYALAFRRRPALP
ncbi:multidrug effflux MFS transporter [Phenylobacterium immobile]|uniref:multidrug effflux MFS transporter n=1 Tax=Phenylobacterium immobile TaxID=21 RepID=UPI000A8949B8|nr:multidrug effflux MFS transporter [Phenylobacterium immobile]